MFRTPTTFQRSALLLSGLALAFASASVCADPDRALGSRAERSSQLDTRSHKTAPPIAYFDGAGTIGLGPQTCLVLHGDAGVTFALGDTGGFVIGDRAWVSGIVTPQSTLCFPAILPALEDNTITRYIEAAGTIILQPQSCLGVLLDNGEIFALENSEGFFLGSRVFVRGIENEASSLCFPAILPVLEQSTVVEFFEGRGTLALGPQTCIVLHADDGRMFSMASIGDFNVGDEVFVTGAVEVDATDCFPSIVDALRESTIAAASSE